MVDVDTNGFYMVRLLSLLYDEGITRSLAHSLTSFFFFLLPSSFFSVILVCFTFSLFEKLELKTFLVALPARCSTAEKGGCF